MRHFVICTTGAALAATLAACSGATKPSPDPGNVKAVVPAPENKDPEGTTASNVKGGSDVIYLAHDKFTVVETRGVDWLLKIQNTDGGWGEDAGSPSLAGNTALASLVLIRSGSTLDSGPHHQALAKAIAFLQGRVRAAEDAKAARLEAQGGSQLQNKLGAHADTFMTATALADLVARMPEGKAKQDLQKDLDAVLGLVQGSQEQNGNWAGGSWAPILQTSFGLMAMEQAGKAGADVDQERIEKVQDYVAKRFDMKQKDFGKAAAEGAGIQLYGTAASLRAMKQVKKDEQRRVQTADAPTAASAPAMGEVKAEVQKGALSQLQNDQFLKGFGSYGGEEFFSFWSVSDALCSEGGENWEKWDTGIRTRISNLQNKDGSWAGHHCITGRVPCTAGALLTLLYDEPAAATASMSSK